MQQNETVDMTLGELCLLSRRPGRFVSHQIRVRFPENGVTRATMAEARGIRLPR
jgi:hypothetical protein